MTTGDRRYGAARGHGSRPPGTQALDETAAQLRIVATLPIRSLDDGKRRLGGRLSPDQRRTMIIACCRTVVAALRESGVIALIGLVSGDPAALEFGRELGVTPIQEERPGLNEAIQTAGNWARTAGAAAHLIVLPDLPLLRAADVRAIACAAPHTAGIVACPDRSRTGTNLLLVKPCGAVQTFFGERSFSRHITAARTAGLTVATYESPGTCSDVDTPDDLDALNSNM